MTEAKRIAALPVRVESKTEWVQTALQKRGGGVELRPLQRLALAEIAAVGGGFFPIGVGHGKTLIALLAGSILECEVAIIIVPASLKVQMHEELSRFSLWFEIPAKTHIISYSSLSKADGTDLLNRLCEGVKDFSKVVLVCDEAHRLKRLQSSRTMRVVRFMVNNPKVHFVALSGTMTTKSLRDFSHLAELALRNGSPVPMERNTLESWAECIDVDGKPGRYDWDRIRFLWSWKYGGGKVQYFNLRTRERQSQVRSAFQDRLRLTPGVVCSEEGSLGCSLNLHEWKGLESPDINRALSLVQEVEEDPAGNVIVDPLHRFRVLSQLTAGYFYEWDWGETPEELRDVWMWRRNQWNRHVRSELSYRSKEGYDSPFLIEQEIRKGGKRSIHKAYEEWTEVKEDANPTPFAVWVDEKPLEDALQLLDWCDSPGILWFQGQAVEEKLRELRPELEVYGAGSNFDQTKARPIALSIRAHGVGKNLQAWKEQVVLSPPSSGGAWEQLLGRTHRAGQQADEVKVTVVQTYYPQSNALLQAQTDARYIEETTGNVQKLNFCNWSKGG